MRITKQMAENVAAGLTLEKFKAIDENERLFRLKLTAFVSQQLPKELIQAFEDEKLRPYICTSKTVKLNGCGFSYDREGLAYEVPRKINENTFIHFENDSIIGNELFKLDEANRIEREMLSSLLFKIETAVFQMRTFKRVEIEFPEALPFLPKDDNTALMVNIQPLREELNR